MLTGSGRRIEKLFWRFALSVFCVLFLSHASYADEIRLKDLISEALKNSPEILAAESRAESFRFRIPQAASLPDPMFMIGYQNEGWRKYTYGDMQMAQWMFSASQTFPFPGKLPLKEEMARRDSEGISYSYESVRLKTVSRVRELFYDLFLAYKSVDLIHDKTALFSRIEDASVARYSSGMGMQQEVLMAQTEKYMLIEREEMLKQKIQSLEAMLNSTIGREVNEPLGRPEEPLLSPYGLGLSELLSMAYEHSPEIRAKKEMVAVSEAREKMAEKEYYPDFTIAANYFNRGGGRFEDMWSLTTAINVPLYYRTKQRQAVLEAKASLAEAKRELESARLMTASVIRDNYSMHKTAERLMDLYKNGLIPRTNQDFESAVAGYASGKTEAVTVINRLKALIDVEILYWTQFAEREKAVSRFEAMAGMMENRGN